MFVRLGGGLVRTVSFGSGAPTLVGVGGWIGSWELWQQPFELLSRRFRTVAYDHHGAGETIGTRDDFSFSAQVRSLFRLLDALEIDRCVLLGESNGGTVATAAALQAPDRFSHLVLVAAPTSGFDHPSTHGFVAALRRDYPGTITRFVELCTPEPRVEHVRRWLRHILLRADVDAAVALIEEMYGVDLRPRLPEIAVPTLIVHGALDALPATRLAAAEEAAQLIPDARLEVIRDAGHVPTLTRPHDVVAAIERLLGDLDGDS